MLAPQVSATECEVACIPLPEIVIIAGEPEALLVTLTLPLTAPVAVGAKTTVKVRFCVGVRVTGVEAPARLNPVPATLIWEIETFALPVFVMVTLCDEVVLVFTFPKLRLVGLKPSVSIAATPFPLNASEFGEVGALLMMEMLPAIVPVAVGKYCALKVVDCPGFNDIGNVTVPVLNPLPAALIWVMVSTAVPLLLN